MAYLSSLFKGPSDRRRQTSETAAPGGGSVTPAAGSSAAPGPAVAPEQGSEANALRAFFDANKGSGGQILSGLAEGINARLQGVADTAKDAVSTTDRVVNGDTISYGYQADPARLQDAQNQYTSAADDARALGSPEGIQALIAQRSGARYTPGMSRLDAWLAQSAAGGMNPAQAQLDAAQRAIDFAANAGNIVTRGTIDRVPGPPNQPRGGGGRGGGGKAGAPSMRGGR